MPVSVGRTTGQSALDDGHAAASVILAHGYTLSAAWLPRCILQLTEILQNYYRIITNQVSTMIDNLNLDSHRSPDKSG